MASICRADLSELAFERIWTIPIDCGVLWRNRANNSKLMTYFVIAEHWWSSYCVQIYLRSIVCYPWIGFELLQSKYNMKSDLAAIIREQMPHAAASGFILDHGIVHLNRSQPPSRLSIDRILPPQMLRNVQYLTHQKYVPVGSSSSAHNNRFHQKRHT
jgi:hypothetical protein